MRSRQPLTEKQIAWFKDHYLIRKDKEVMDRLNIGAKRLSSLAKAHGLEKPKKERKESTGKPMVKNPIYLDEGCTRYCLDCLHYQTGGICRKSGNAIGALWQKRCFTEGGENPPYS